METIVKNDGCLKCINVSSTIYQKQRRLLDIVRYVFLPHLFGKPNPQKNELRSTVSTGKVVGLKVNEKMDSVWTLFDLDTLLQN